MHGIRRRKLKPPLLLTQGIFNLPYHIAMVLWEELAFDDDASYASREMDCSTAKCYSSDRDSHLFPQLPTPHYNQSPQPWQITA